ncbi:MAG: hypothetical protein AB1297_05920, partial [bacterium]
MYINRKETLNIKKLFVSIFFVLLAKEGEGKMPVFSSFPSTLTSNVLRLGQEVVDWFPAPILYDWDRDGRKDLLVGDKDGYIRFYPNHYVPSVSPYPTKVKVTPSVIYSSGIGSWFNIDIDIDNVKDLAILNLTLLFNPKKVNISPWGTPTKGGFLGGGNWGNELVIDREQGKLEIRNFILPSLTSGTGTLVDNIRFEVLENSLDSLVLQGILYGSNHEVYEIPCEFKGGEVYPEGYIPVEPIVPAFQFSTYTFLEYGLGTERIVVNVGRNAKPCITDYNRDGIIDLLVGCESGEIYLVLGTNTSPYLLTPKKLEAGTMYVKTFPEEAAGIVNNVFVSGGYAYVAQGLAGLSIYDITNISTPKLVGAINPATGVVNDVFVDGEYAYIANGAAGLLILKIDDPKNIKSYSYKSNHTGIARGIIVIDKWAYIANGNKGLWVVNTDDVINYNPSNPQVIRENVFLQNDIIKGNANSVLYADGYILVSVGAQGVYCISVDVTQQKPEFTFKWNATNYAPGNDALGMAIFQNSYLYVASGVAGIACFQRREADWGNSPIYTPAEVIIRDTPGYANDIEISRV